MLRKQARNDIPAAKAAEVADSQRQWFGRPLHELFGTVIDICGLTQAQLAERLGVSAPMVSQLMSGRREKPGNPVVQERVIALGRALEDLEAGRIEASQVRELVDSMPSAPSLRSSAAHRAVAVGADPTTTAAYIQLLVSRVAEGKELTEAVGLLNKKCPNVAEMLRVYGPGSISEATEHLRRHGLL